MIIKIYVQIYMYTTRLIMLWLFHVWLNKLSGTMVEPMVEYIHNMCILLFTGLYKFVYVHRSMCLTRDSLELKDFGHLIHWKDLLCVCMWARRFDLSANFLPHSAQPKGFSPVWDLMCPCRSQGRENPLLHTPHLCERLCVKICIERAGVLTYILLQIWQHLAFSAVSALWVCLCLERFELVAKCFPHSSHRNLS